MINGRGNSFLDFIRIANIGRYGKCFAACFIDRGSGRLQVLELSAHEGHTRAGFGERARDASGDTGATTGHESDFAVKNSVNEYFLIHMLSLILCATSVS